MAHCCLYCKPCCELQRWIEQLHERTDRPASSYIIYGHADDDYRRQALEFGRESLLAYCVVVRFFRRQEWYRTREPVIHLRPANEGILQVHALRRRLGVEPWEPTPPEAGKFSVCRHCSRWSAFIQEPNAKRLWEVGETKHYIDPRDGECYCSYSKFPKHALVGRREAAGCDRREEREEEDEEEEEPEEEVAVEALDYDEDGMPILTANVRVENPMAPAPEIKTHDRRLLSQALTNMGSSKAITSCGGQPLRPIDMIGVWYRVKRGFYGLCSFCGNLVAVEQRKVTPWGLNCGNHDQLAITAPGGHNPLILNKEIVCAACGTGDDAFLALQVIRLFDERYNTFEVPLCKVHMGVLSRLGPTLTIGHQNATNMYPIALLDVFEPLRLHGLRQRARAPIPLIMLPKPEPLPVMPWQRLERLIDMGARMDQRLLIVYGMGEQRAYFTALDLRALDEAEQGH